MGFTITGGTTNGIDFGAMYHNSDIWYRPDREDKENGLLGVIGYVQYMSPRSGEIVDLADAMIWLDSNNGLAFVKGERYFPRIDKTLPEFVAREDSIEYILEMLEPHVNVEEYPDGDFYREIFEIGISEKLAKKIGAYYDMYAHPIVRINLETFEISIGVASSGSQICSYAPAYDKGTFTKQEINEQKIFFDYLAYCFGYYDENCGRVLSPIEKIDFVANRKAILNELNELQADLEDLSDEELVNLRGTMLERVNTLLALALETNEDNLG